ncbi:MAG: ATP-binding protein [Planctomycetota bacterium]|jgi:CheY-like chemotaxis protein/anti-sigma regulatory factor (Ser/Thr protein kinase)
MPKVLVVDDSAVDRRLVAEFLKQDKNLEVHYAVDGSDALANMEEHAPDLVVTDLMMPQVDGLELVESTKKRHPLVPVILITSKGSEEVVVQALRKGAASYVPKHALSQRLLSTVRNVLAVSHRRRGHSRLMERITKVECNFVLNNDSTLIHPLVTYLQDQTTHLDLCDDSDRTRIGVALEEALTNAILHGNLEVGSELRGQDERAYHAQIVERSKDSPYQDRQVHVDATMSRDQATVTVRDEGTGFDPATLPNPIDPANLEKASGRGLLLMRTFMDEVQYNETGNAVTLVKRRRPPADDDGSGSAGSQ